MKKNFILLTLLCLSLNVYAFEYIPKNADVNPFAGKSGLSVKAGQTTSKTTEPEKREIRNLAEYFKYLPREVHRNWTPYKADRDYEITVQFVVHKDGSISNVQIIGTNYPNANRSVIDAVQKGAPYQPLPKSFERESVKAQIFLEYHKQAGN